MCVGRLGFSVLVYGLGSKKALLEDFRLSELSEEIHLVINGFFPSITLKSVSKSDRLHHSKHVINLPLHSSNQLLELYC